MKRARNKRETRGLLLKGILESVPSESFEILRKELREIMHGFGGIYALYKDKRVYYVGLARNLDGRLYAHLERDKHKGKWNNFSIFFVQRTRYLKDFETLVLRIAKPKANRMSGKIPRHHDLRRALRRQAKQLRRKAGQIVRALR